MSQRFKILISAYACSPYQGSEAAVGWGFVTSLSRMHDLWVIVEEEKFRADIERFRAKNPELYPSIRFFFIKKKRNRLLRKIWPPSYYHYYRKWHQCVFELAQELHREIRFDLVHQVTMVGFREPGNLWQLGVPFVWGPIGGMGLFPWRFLTSVGLYGGLYYLGYNIYNLLQMNFLKSARMAAQKAGIGLIAASPENQAGTAYYWKCPSTLICEVGLPPTRTGEPLRRTGGEPFKMVWVGLHTPGKALNLALQALGLLPAGFEWELHVLGKGRRTETWKRMAVSNGIAGRCLFHGWIERNSALEIMGSAHLMLITSLRELTSTVTIEALAQGLPIVCLDHCGFGSVVDDSCGLKVPVETPRQVIHDLTAAVQLLMQDEALRHQLASGALRRAADYSWDQKAAAVHNLYLRKLSSP